jgi:hypothetical protein
MRKSRWLMAVVIGGSVMVSLASRTRADDKDKPPSDEELRAQMVKCLATAAEVEQFGRKHKAPEALVSAGGILLKVDALTRGKMEKLEGDVEDDKGNKLDVPAEEEKSLKEQANKLFSEAREMGASMDLRPGTVEALIKAARVRNYSADEEFKGRGAIGGPKRITRKIQAGGHQVHSVRFRANEVASIAFQSNYPVRLRIVSPGQGDLSNNIVQTNFYNWVPRQPITIRISVQNLGHNAQYTITTN